MKIEYETNVDELGKGIGTFLARNSIVKVIYSAGFLAGPLLGWWFALHPPLTFGGHSNIRFSVHQNGSTTSTALNLSQPIALFYAILYFGLTVWFWSWYWKRTAGKFGRALIGGKMRPDTVAGLRAIELDEFGVHFSMPLEQRDLHWKMIKNVQQSDGFIFIMPLTGALLILPKRAFPNADDEKSFMDYCQSQYRQYHSLTSSAAR